MKNKFLKIFALICVSAMLIGVLASCGQTKASDANGTWGNLSWTYTSSTSTLIISGNGEMPTVESADKVGWASVKGSVQNVVFAPKDGKNITSIGDYAFHGMTSLKSIDIPADVKRVGKCAFAFCSALEEIDMPSALESLGESAFEACVSLKNIKLPATATKLGERAFAFCRSLEIAILEGKPEAIGKWTFKDCAKLSKLAIAGKAEGTTIDGAAFEGAAINKDKITAYNGNVTVTVKFVDTSTNKELAASKTEMKVFGDSYSYTAPNIDGYTIVGDNVKSGKVEGENIEIVFKYTPGAATEAPVETEPAEDKKDRSSAGTIIALVIFGVVIVGICVGVFLFIRSDKKQKKNGSTVRKNASNKGKGKKK